MGQLTRRVSYAKAYPCTHMHIVIAGIITRLALRNSRRRGGEWRNEMRARAAGEGEVGRFAGRIRSRIGEIERRVPPWIDDGEEGEEGREELEKRFLHRTSKNANARRAREYLASEGRNWNRGAPDDEDRNARTHDGTHHTSFRKDVLG